MTAFSPDAARALVGHTDFRVAAAERFTATPMPSSDEEIWRYSRIDGFDLADYRPAIATTTVEGGIGATGAI